MSLLIAEIIRQSDLMINDVLIKKAYIGSYICMRVPCTCHM